MEFKLSSPIFNNGTLIPSKYTCDGQGLHPHLAIHGVPRGTRSLALIVEDPDAPSGVFTHWVMWDIPPETAEIRERSVPFGAEEGLNSSGETGYIGPCPASGTHRYFFRLFALSTRIRLPAGSTRAELEEAMTGHILASTELMGTYMRTNAAPL